MIKTVKEIQNEIIEDMSHHEDWMDKYEYLISLGKTLPPMDPSLKANTFSVPGCQNRIWVSVEIQDGKLVIQADSDTYINKGLIALVLRVLNGRTIDEINNTDLYFIRESGLRSNLSPSRASGLLAFIDHIKNAAKAL
jgi:cysteine desulfuration protein SufE